MENDYEVLKEVLEVAEVLTLETESTLEVATYHEITGKSTTVVFHFNPSMELINVYATE